MRIEKETLLHFLGELGVICQTRLSSSAEKLLLYTSTLLMSSYQVSEIMGVSPLKYSYMYVCMQVFIQVLYRHGINMSRQKLECQSMQYRAIKIRQSSNYEVQVRRSQILLKNFHSVIFSMPARPTQVLCAMQQFYSRLDFTDSIKQDESQ